MPRHTVPKGVLYLVATVVLALALLGTLSLVLSRTILSSSYLDTELKQTDSYTALSAAISDEITKQSNEAQQTNPQEVAIIRSIITPEVVESRLSGVLAQTEEYLKHDGPVPQLDLTDLVAQARAAGLDIPADSDIAKPITLGSAETEQHVAQTAQTIKTGETILLVLTGVFAVLFLVLCWLQRDFRVVATLGIVYGAFLIVISLLLWLTSSLALHNIQENGNEIAVIMQKLATSITQDHASRFGLIGGLVLVVGVATRILLGKLHKSSAVQKG